MLHNEEGEAHTPAPPQQPETSSPSGISDILRVWANVISAMAFSTTCFIAIVVLLMFSRNKPSPKFAFGVTLNALMSLLATGCKASLIFVVGECIGQLKWIWFHSGKRSRKLKDMEYFDNASRGPWGSASILLQHQGRSLVSLGAVVVLLALAFDPFMQQLLTYSVRHTPEPSSSSRAKAKQEVSLLSDLIAPSEETLIYIALWYDDMLVQPTCPSGHCTWLPFESVEMCSHCEDITLSTTLECDKNEFDMRTSRNESTYCMLDLPGGRGYNNSVDLQINHGDSLLALTFTHQALWTPVYQPVGHEHTSTATFFGVPSPLLVTAFADILLANSGPVRDGSNIFNLRDALQIHHVTQCILTLCSRIYTMTTRHGDSTFNPSPPDYGTTFLNPSAPATNPGNSSSSSSSSSSELCWKPNRHNQPYTLLESTPGIWTDESSFSFCPIADYAFLTAFDEQRQHTVSATNTSSWRPAGPDTWLGSSSASSSSSSPPLPYARRVFNIGLEHAMHRIGVAFTQAALLASNVTREGTVSWPEAYVSVVWGWLVLPGCLVVGSGSFLLLTVMVNQRQRMAFWGSSVLPVLCHGLEVGHGEEEEEGGGNFPTLACMGRAASNQGVKLRVVDRRRGLVLHRE